MTSQGATIVVVMIEASNAAASAYGGRRRSSRSARAGSAAAEPLPASVLGGPSAPATYGQTCRQPTRSASSAPITSGVCSI